MFGVIDNNQIAIMSEALGCDIDVNIRYRNPLREDRRAGCSMKWYNGILFFVDFAYNPTHISAIDMLRLTKGVRVNRYYDNRDSISSKPVVRDTKIDVVLRDFSAEDQRYWGKYNISCDMLMEYGCRALKRVQVNSKDIFVDKYCYGIFVEGRVKVYSPFSKSMKWVSNVLQEHIGFMRRLSVYGDRVIVTKSFKDAVCLLSLGFSDVCWVQSEAVVMNRQAMFSLSKRFDEVVIFFDNDEVGVSYGERLKDRFLDVTKGNIRTIYVDDRCKDISDYVFRYGADKGREHMLGLLR